MSIKPWLKLMWAKARRLAKRRKPSEVVAHEIVDGKVVFKRKTVLKPGDWLEVKGHALTDVKRGQDGRA